MSIDGLAARLDSALVRGRAAALARMASRVNIYRRPSMRDVDYGVWNPVYVDWPFRLGGIPGRPSTSQTVTVGGAQTTVPVRTGHLPIGTALMDGDCIAIIRGENLGLFFEVIEGDLSDQQTAVRVPLRGITKPDGWKDAP